MTILNFTRVVSRWWRSFY